MGVQFSTSSNIQAKWEQVFQREQRSRKSLKSRPTMPNLPGTVESDCINRLLSSTMLKYQENYCMKPIRKEGLMNRYGLNRTVLYAPTHLSHAQNLWIDTVVKRL